jgi:transposase
MQKDGYSLLLPAGMLDYFEITKVEEKNKEIIISLEEKNNINPESGKPQYESKGFYPVVSVNDFPVRGKQLVLEIRRRRWIEKETGKYIDRDFHLIAEGARITQEFAAFLKGLY